jgi:HlyD family secretion protein
VLAAGSPVASGQPMLTVTDASTLSLTAQVDETDVLLVQPGVPAAAELDAVPDATYRAEVTSIDPTPTSSSRGGVTYVVRLSLGRGTSPGGTTAPTPRPGMSAVVDLQVRTAERAVAVPAAAVFRDGRRDAVWVVQNGDAQQRVVRLGAQGTSRVQVVEGLKVGEQVVVRGADRVRDGQQVP